MTSKDSQDRSMRDVVFGAQQRRLRTLRGISVTELARDLGYSDDLIRKVENGIRRARPEYVARADEILDAKGVLVAAAEELAQLTLYPEWFEEYVETEASCLNLHSYNTHVVHGLLQTHDYARGVLSAHYPSLDDDEVEARVQGRLKRRDLLTRKPMCMLSFAIEEWVLRRPIGGRAVMRSQLLHLLECAKLRNITIQIVPMSCESHAGFDGPMTLLGTDDGQTVAYVEGQAGSAWVTSPLKVVNLEGRYGIIRSEALNTEESLRLIEEVAGEL